MSSSPDRQQSALQLGSNPIFQTPHPPHSPPSRIQQTEHRQLVASRTTPLLYQLPLDGPRNTYATAGESSGVVAYRHSPLDLKLHQRRVSTLSAAMEMIAASASAQLDTSAKDAKCKLQEFLLLSRTALRELHHAALASSSRGGVDRTLLEELKKFDPLDGGRRFSLNSPTVPTSNDNMEGPTKTPSENLTASPTKEPSMSRDPLLPPQLHRPVVTATSKAAAVGAPAPSENFTASPIRTAPLSSLSSHVEAPTTVTFLHQLVERALGKIISHIGDLESDLNGWLKKSSSNSLDEMPSTTTGASVSNNRAFQKVPSPLPFSTIAPTPDPSKGLLLDPKSPFGSHHDVHSVVSSKRSSVTFMELDHEKSLDASQGAMLVNAANGGSFGDNSFFSGGSPLRRGSGVILLADLAISEHVRSPGQPSASSTAAPTPSLTSFLPSSVFASPAASNAAASVRKMLHEFDRSPEDHQVPMISLHRPSMSFPAPGVMQTRPPSPSHAAHTTGVGAAAASRRRSIETSIDSSHGGIHATTHSANPIAFGAGAGRNRLVGLPPQLMPLASTTTNQFRQLFALQSINSQPSAMETSEIGIVTTTNSAEKTVDDDTGIKMLNNYIMMDTIGEGACGKVKLAFSLERNISVAIKIVKKSLLAAGDGDMSRSLGRAQDNREIALRREIAIMKKLRHKNLVALYEVIDDPAAAKLYLVMQYVDHGCVTQMRTDGTCDRLDPLRLANLAAQIASGLKYLHEHDVVHRDIKPENLLVDHDDHLYLSDFGVSELMSAKKDRLAPHRQNSVVDSQGGSSPPDSPTTSLPSRSTPHNTLRLVGTPLFMAPELHDPNSEGRAWTVADRVAIDMWAFGVTLYALLMGRLPFPSIRHILDDAAPLNFSWPTSSVSTASPVSSEWRALIRSLLHRDVTKRPTADVIRRAAKAINRQLNAEQQKTEPSAAAELQMVPRTPKVLVTDEDVESAFSSVDERRGSNSNLIAVSQRFSRQIAASQDEFVSVGEKVSGGNGDEGMFVQVSETKELSDEEPPISPTIDDEFDEPRRGSDGRNGRPSPQEVHHLHGWHHHHTAGGGDGVRHVHASHAPKGLSPSGVEL